MKRFLKAVLISFVAVGLAASASFAAPLGKFVAKDAEGKAIKSEDMVKEGKTLLIFAQTACSQCRTELADINANWDKIKDMAKVYVVLVDTNTQRALDQYKANNYPMPVLLDPDFGVGAAAGVEATPATVSIEKGGEIKFFKMGYKPGQIMDIMEKM